MSPTSVGCWAAATATATPMSHVGHVGPPKTRLYRGSEAASSEPVSDSAHLRDRQTGRPRVSRRRQMVASRPGNLAPAGDVLRATLHCCELLIAILMRLRSVRCPDREVVTNNRSSCVNQLILYRRQISD